MKTLIINFISHEVGDEIMLVNKTIYSFNYYGYHNINVYLDNSELLAASFDNKTLYQHISIKIELNEDIKEEHFKKIIKYLQPKDYYFYEEEEE
jgi:hypothetical protein